MGFRSGRSEERKAALEGGLSEFISRLRQTDVRKAILFGSLARGDVGPKSDVDLVLIRDTHEPFVRRGDDLIGLLPAGCPVDLIIYTPSEWGSLAERNPFMNRVRKEGVTVYEA